MTGPLAFAITALCLVLLAVLAMTSQAPAPEEPDTSRGLLPPDAYAREG